MGGWADGWMGGWADERVEKGWRAGDRGTTTEVIVPVDVATQHSRGDVGASGATMP